jgi:hypothetical protein
LISSIITIIIPSENCLFDLKKTIENISDQTKIRGTKILVLDKESSDGSIQYVTQASFDFRNILNIQVIDCSKDFFPIKEEELNRYVIWIKPGIIFKSKDSIFNLSNLINSKQNPLIFTNKNFNFLRRLYTNKDNIDISFIACKKDDNKIIEYKKEGEKIIFPFTNNFKNKKYSLLKESVLS